jgi:5'-nucleotidase
MRVLLTNDDGIHSPGLWAIAKSLEEIADLTVVVPDRDQSGKGASMTLLRPLTVEKINTPKNMKCPTYTVDGTPGECVIMACESLCNDPIDLIVSGINQGANMGLDVFNSGTFGAALHGFFRGINSIALSVFYKQDVIYSPAALIGAEIAKVIHSQNFGSTVLLNVNLPACDFKDIGGVDLTELGPKAYLENVETVESGRRTFHWLRHNKPMGVTHQKGTDVWSIHHDRASVTMVNPYLTTDNKTELGKSVLKSSLECLGLAGAN